MHFDILPMTEKHWDAVRQIYGEGIATGKATFEESVPDWTQWDARHLPTCRLIARGGDAVLGWAALSRVSSRQVYQGVAEVSIYHCRARPRPRHWGGVADGAYRRVRAQWHLDLAGRHFR